MEEFWAGEPHNQGRVLGRLVWRRGGLEQGGPGCGETR